MRFFLNEFLEIIAEVLEIQPSKVKPDSNFVRDLKLDSLDTVKLVVSLERYYEIKICDDDVQNLRTPKTTFEYIEKIKGLE